MEANSIYKWKIEGISGETIALEQYEGKKMLIVNVASECGYTPQYAQLQELYEAFKDQLIILACPCNDFGGQEPGDQETIKQFCERSYGVQFPVTAKLNIKSQAVHPLYQWLTQKEQNGVMDVEIRWNFYKFLIDEKGHLINAFPSNTGPFDEPLFGLISN